MKAIVLIPPPHSRAEIPYASTMASPREVTIVLENGKVGMVQLQEKSNAFSVGVFANSVKEKIDHSFFNTDFESFFQNVYRVNKGVVSYNMIYETIQRMGCTVRPLVFYRWYDPKYEEVSEIINEFLLKEGTISESLFEETEEESELRIEYRTLSEAREKFPRNSKQKGCLYLEERMGEILKQLNK